MTSPFLGWIRRYRGSLAAGSLDLWVAVPVAIFALMPSAIGLDGPAVQIPPAARALLVTARAMNDARLEQPAEPAGSEVRGESPERPRADDQPPLISGGTAVLADTASHVIPGSAPTPEPGSDEVNRYLWTVYERSTIKRDGSGDFTWKDIAAANRLGLSLGDYVIRGMDPDFRELLYRAGQAIDAAGIRWTIRSAFRDDYRQSLAAGYKARTDNSLHGGSAAIGGYGHGCAVDVADPDSKSDALWKWLDANGVELGLQRPFPGIDPAHILPRGAWHELADALRKERLAGPAQGEEVPVVDLAAVRSAEPSEGDLPCINGHRHRDDTVQASVPANTPAHQGFKLASAHSREAGKSSPHAKTAARSSARHAGHAVARTAGTS